VEGLNLTFWLTLASFACWPVCFWWMHRISKEQSAVLKQLGEQGKRIERLSKEEHKLVKELHPQVDQIREGVEQIADTTSKKASGRSQTP
jgi:septal ring factor EnvC (AmiA/AmiB activator)